MNKLSDKLYKVNPDELIIRDHLAVDRTALANERTFLAYIRTAIAAGATGFGLIKLFTSLSTTIIGWIIIFLGIIVLIIGIIRFFQFRRKINVLSHAYEIEKKNKE